MQGPPLLGLFHVLHATSAQQHAMTWTCVLILTGRYVGTGCAMYSHSQLLCQYSLILGRMHLEDPRRPHKRALCAHSRLHVRLQADATHSQEGVVLHERERNSVRRLREDVTLAVALLPLCAMYLARIGLPLGWFQATIMSMHIDSAACCKKLEDSATRA